MDNQHINPNVIHNMNQSQGLDTHVPQHELNGHSLTDSHGNFDHSHRHHGLGGHSDHTNNQHRDMHRQDIGMSNTPIHDQYSQDNFNSQNGGMMPQRTEMNNYPQNSMHNPSAALGQDNNLYDQGSGRHSHLQNQGLNHHNPIHNKVAGMVHHDQSNLYDQESDHHSHLQNQGSSHHNPIHDKVAGMGHHDQSHNQLGNTNNLAGATVEDINRATHQQTDPPFVPGMSDFQTQGNSQHLSNSVPSASGQFIGNTTTRTYPAHDLYQAGSYDSSPKTRPTSHPVLGNNDYSQNMASTSQPISENITRSPVDRNFPGNHSSNTSPTDRNFPSSHSSNMSPTEHHLPGHHSSDMSRTDHQMPGHHSHTPGRYSADMTPTSHPIPSNNNNTSILNRQSEHLRGKDGTSAVSSTPSEYGSSEDNMSPRTASSQDMPVADKNAFIETNTTKKHWQHSMSPAARAKELGAEMHHVLQSRKSPKRKSLKIGEKKEYKLD